VHGEGAAGILFQPRDRVRTTVYRVADVQLHDHRPVGVREERVPRGSPSVGPNSVGWL
jgi:hypothetical protein